MERGFDDRAAEPLVSSALQHRHNNRTISRVQGGRGRHPQRAGCAKSVDLASCRRRQDRLRGRIAAHPSMVYRSAREARAGVAHGRCLCSGTCRAAGARSAGGNAMRRQSPVARALMARVSPLARACMACVLAIAGVIATSAQVKQGATAADVANYTVADRMQKIIAGAKKEGTLTVYTSLQTADIGKLGAAFEKKYGVKVVPWRSGSEDIVQRSVQEARANRNTVD